MASRIETKLRAALAGYTTEHVVASYITPSQSKQIAVRITHSLETLPKVSYLVRDGNTVVLSTEHLTEAVIAYCGED